MITRFESNCKFVKVTDRGWPHIFLVAHKSISAGERVLVDNYGATYWGTRKKDEDEVTAIDLPSLMQPHLPSLSIRTRRRRKIIYA
jgi:hypothetical protein